MNKKGWFLLLKKMLGIAALLFCLFQVGNAQDAPPRFTDIEISMSTPQPAIGQWKSLPVTVTIKNTGSDVATNVEVTIRTCTDERPYPTTELRKGGIVFANTSYQATKGSFSTFPILWSIPDLGAGESATLTVNYFTLTEDPIRLLAYLLRMDQEDIDSAPSPDYRNQSCEAPEDDEAVLIINPAEPTACEGDVRFTTQQAFDAYFANCFEFPTAKSYTGSITLEGPDIKNLDVLDDLSVLRGNFSLINTSVYGLGRVFESSSTLEGDFKAVGNPNLAILRLWSILSFKDDASISIQDNPNLEFLSLPFASQRMKNLQIIRNPLLKEVQMNGFQLEEVEVLSISGNPQLTFFPLNKLQKAIILSITTTAIPVLNLENLSSLKSDLTIGGNSELTEIKGFGNINSIDGSVTIADNAKLENLGGLANLERIGGLRIIRSNALTTINLPNLQIIGRDVFINKLSAIRDLDQLSNLQHINGQLTITENVKLTSIDGLKNLITLNKDSNPGGLVILDNPDLSACCIVPNLLEIATVQGNTDIQRNGLGCSSIEEINTACPTPATCDLEIVNISFPTEGAAGESFLIKTTIKNNTNAVIGSRNLKLFQEQTTRRQPTYDIKQFKTLAPFQPGETRVVEFNATLPSPLYNDGTLPIESPIDIKDKDFYVSVTASMTEFNECRELIDFTVKDPTGDLSIGYFSRTERCIDEQGRINGELRITNKGNSIVKAPIYVAVGTCNNLSALATATQERRCGNTFSTNQPLPAYWVILKDMAPGDRVNFSQPYQVLSGATEYTIKASILQKASNYQDVGSGDNQLEFTVNKVCTVLCEQSCPINDETIGQGDVVCGSDGKTYGNACLAECAGVTWTPGPCEEVGITCGEITIQPGIDQLTIKGKPGENYFFKVFRTSPKWEYVFQCSANCGSSVTVNNLATGTYFVDVFDKNWKPLCDDIEVDLIAIGNNEKTDLELEITTNNPFPVEGQTFEVYLTVKNTSRIAASNIQIGSFNYCNVTKSSEGSFLKTLAVSPSKGSIGGGGIWKLDELDPNSSQTLTYTYELLTKATFSLGTGVLTVTPDDIDSTPLLGDRPNFCTIEEDDEALFTFNPKEITTCDILNTIDTDPCNLLVKQFATYRLDGKVFLVATSDAYFGQPTTVRDCETGDICYIDNNIQDVAICPDFLEKATLIEVISKREDCTDCEFFCSLEGPRPIEVCGSDGKTYSSACKANCAGVTWTEGICTSTGITCGEITVIPNEAQTEITIRGKAGENYFFKVHRTFPKWEQVLNCVAGCGSEVTISNLASGRYFIDVYDKSWKLICDDITVDLFDLGIGGLQNTIASSSRNSVLNTNNTKTNQPMILYPNPAQQQVTIKLNKQIYPNANLYISNHLGQLVKTIATPPLDQTTIFLDHFENGLYQVNVVSEGRVVASEKLVIMK